MSVDKGATFTVVSPGRILINLKFHPKQSQWLLAGAVDTNNPFSDTQAVVHFFNPNELSGLLFERLGENLGHN